MAVSYVIFDLDGTLANVEHRRHFVAQGKRKDFTAFYEAMEQDTPNAPVVALAQALHAAGHKIICCSSRPETYYHRTEAQLKAFGVPYWSLYMRYEGDNRPDDVVKRDKLAMIRAVYGEPLFAVDDRQKVVDMWRSEGVTCLQCAPGAF